MPRPVTRALLAVVTTSAAAAGCARVAPCDGVSCEAACPRDAVVDSSGRCACVDGDVPLLGACVPPPVGEAFCGPGEQIESGRASGGCSFRACGPGQSLDVVSGACTPRSSLPGGSICREPAVPIVEAGRPACVAAEAACPRGTRLSGAREGHARTCDRPPACPPGSLAEGRTCRAIVTGGGRAGSRVDVGAWAALALGIHGGAGSSALCQPLAQRPALFGIAPGASGASEAELRADGGALEPARRAIRVAVAILLPDQDVSRVHAKVRATQGGHPLSAVAEALVWGAVSTALEGLRGLGGEASAASVELEVTCAVGEAWAD